MECIAKIEAYLPDLRPSKWVDFCPNIVLLSEIDSPPSHDLIISTESLIKMLAVLDFGKLMVAFISSSRPVLAKETFD